MRHGATPSAGDLSAAIVTHARSTRTLALDRPIDPVAALARLIGRERPVLVRHGGRTIVAADPDRVAEGADLWSALDAPAEPREPGTAMAGGWVGLLAYDLDCGERRPAPRPDALAPPAGALARYPTVAAVDDDGRCLISTTGSEADLRETARLLEGAPPPARLGPPRRLPLASSLPGGDYAEAVQAARELIRAGDCYQVNLAQRLSAPWDGDVIGLARRLWSAAGPAARRGLVATPQGVVVSASPELLACLRDGLAASAPIKGTAAPGAAAALAASPKDRAEHVMIVDLVRNDLGRVARPGGVRVRRLMEPLVTPYVDHLVSEVVAEPAPGTRRSDLVRAVFPGGSVTGCPKVRAMEVIHELEPVARGPAFGSLLALGADGALEASVAIRTAWLAGEEARYWCGGAVVWDSDPRAESREAWAKATPFLRAVGR